MLGVEGGGKGERGGRTLVVDVVKDVLEGSQRAREGMREEIGRQTHLPKNVENRERDEEATDAHPQSVEKGKSVPQARRKGGGESTQRTHWQRR